MKPARPNHDSTEITHLTPVAAASTADMNNQECIVQPQRFSRPLMTPAWLEALSLPMPGAAATLLQHSKETVVNIVCDNRRKICQAVDMG